MKKILRRLALLVLVGASITWLATGANRGWTKTSEPVKTIDEVIGIEGITTKNVSRLDSIFWARRCWARES